MVRPIRLLAWLMPARGLDAAATLLRILPFTPRVDTRRPGPAEDCWIQARDRTPRLGARGEEKP
jgi:hypothetical protein